MTKTCRSCNAEKPENDFYKSQPACCKDCYKAKVKAYQTANIERVRARDRVRNDLPKRVAARESYAKTDRGKKTSAAAKKAWASRNPEKRAAHITLGNAVRDGRVIKPRRCNRCGEAGRLHAHHEDYAKPLAVEWLCSPCHRAEHEGG